LPTGIKKKDDFTEKDADFIEKWRDADFDISKRQGCAEAAGLGTGEIARLNGGRVTKAMLNNRKLRAALKRVDVNWDSIAGKLKELLDAKSVYNENMPDNFIQHKTVETLIRVMDANPPQKIEVDKNTTTQIIITDEAAKRLEEYRKMRELNYDEKSGCYTERP
jgi:hypothetical protein